MRDPYEVLGVKKDADARAIKSAYHKLAKKLHPDANKADPQAAQRFAELNAAHEILADKEKRKAYDRGAIDAEGKPRFYGPHGGAGAGQANPDFNFEYFSQGPEGFRQGGGAQGGFSNLEDVLGSVFGGLGGGSFGGSASRRGRARTRTGFEPEEFGETTGRDIAAIATITLPEVASGTTRRVQLPTGKEVDVKIPLGMTDGKQIRLKGQGMPGPGGAGDVLITIKVAPHPFFKVEGANLRIDVPITLYEAVLGGKVRVPTLGGAVEINIPPETSSGRTFRIRGKGLPSEGMTGDLYATVLTVLPEQPDPALEELMRQWRDRKPYDPRKALGLN